MKVDFRPLEHLPEPGAKRIGEEQVNQVLRARGERLEAEFHEHRNNPKSCEACEEKANYVALGGPWIRRVSTESGEERIAADFRYVWVCREHRWVPAQHVGDYRDWVVIGPINESIESSNAQNAKEARSPSRRPHNDSVAEPRDAGRTDTRRTTD